MSKRRGAPEGNQNARLGEHQLVVRIPVQLADKLYGCLEVLGLPTDAREAGKYVRSTLEEEARQVLGRANNEPLCSQCGLLGEIYCEICQPAAWYCGWHYEKKHFQEEEEKDNGDH